MEQLQGLINQIALKVHRCGGKMYYIGGYVRDLYLGREPSDIDVRVIGISKEQFCHILEEFGKIHIINAKFDIIKLRGYDIDFASPENKDGSIRTIEESIQNVDFTMNGIFMDVITGEVIDPYNGIGDIKNGIIRAARLDELEGDVVRAIRACRFKAKLGFKIEKTTSDRIKNFSFEGIKTQRILLEIRKLLNDEVISQSEFYRVALELGILGKLFPPLHQMSGLEVEINGVKVDAFEHTMNMINYLMRFKDRIDGFEDWYMACLTYHLRSVVEDKDRDNFSKFFSNGIATNSMKNIIRFLQNNEEIVFSTYRDFQDMSSEIFNKIYRKFRRKLEFSGYIVESLDMAAKGDITNEDLRQSDDRLRSWEDRIFEARQLYRDTLKPPKITKADIRYSGKNGLFNGEGRSLRGNSGYSLADIGVLTRGIGPNRIGIYFSNSIATGKAKQGGKHARNRKKGGRTIG